MTKNPIAKAVRTPRFRSKTMPNKKKQYKMDNYNDSWEDPEDLYPNDDDNLRYEFERFLDEEGYD